LFTPTTPGIGDKDSSGATSATAPYRYFLYHVAYGAIVSYAPAKTSTFGSNRQIILVAV